MNSKKWEESRVVVVMLLGIKLNHKTESSLLITPREKSAGQGEQHIITRGKHRSSRTLSREGSSFVSSLVMWSTKPPQISITNLIINLDCNSFIRISWKIIMIRSMWIVGCSSNLPIYLHTAQAEESSTKYTKAAQNLNNFLRI